MFRTLTSDVLESGSDDFESGEDIHDAVGSILTEVAGDEGEEDIIDICNQLMGALKGCVETSNNVIIISYMYTVCSLISWRLMVCAPDSRSSTLVFEGNQITVV